MKSIAGVLLVCAAALIVGYLLGNRSDPHAVARVDSLVDRSRRDDSEALRRDIAGASRIARTRAATNARIKPSVAGPGAPLAPEVVREIVETERAACDSTIAEKDTTIAEARELRDDAIQEARRLARRNPSRLAVAFQVRVPEMEPEVAVSYRVTRILGLDLNAGLSYRLR